MFLRSFSTSLKTRLNAVTLVGRVGQTPDHVKFDAGEGYYRFSLATNNWIKKGDQFEQVTTWHNIRTTSDVTAIPKGSIVSVQGSIVYWKNEKTGGAFIRGNKVEMHHKHEETEEIH